MAEHRVKLLSSKFVTHDVKRFIVEKPENYTFTPGQATDVSLGIEGFEDKKHPFTFTSLNEDKVIEFTIKSYPVKEFPEHKGVTEKLHELMPGEELILQDPWGTIEYKGKGVFIAGGAGITPFIAIFRDLHSKGKLAGNKLFFSNKESRDIILEKELRYYFGNDLILTLTREKTDNGYKQGRVDKEMLEANVDDFGQHFYICGPKTMVQDLKDKLSDLGAKSDGVVFEK